MTIFLVLIRPIDQGADKGLRSNCWIVTAKTLEIRETERIEE